MTVSVNCHADGPLFKKILLGSSDWNDHLMQQLLLL